ncbi:MAG: substrate-binding domain-containing protein [Solirubrobacteraceae bacterium]|nr:substrate-binding domain-containing protein [Solirubrobacteraceae bacterium]
MPLTIPRSARRLGLTAAMLALALPLASAKADTIRVQSTTDTIDAGLVVGLLGDAYKTAQPRDELAYVGVGTGKALDNARAGLADVVITHAPSLEAIFVNDGFSLEPVGRAIFYSDYVIVGPSSDPAGVLGSAPHDAITAFERIAAAGADGKATFVSRGDNSGTNVQEQTMWGLTDASVSKQAALNGGGSAVRLEPGSGGTSPAWYEKTNLGQAANLNVAEACTPTGANPNGGCYTLVDRGTFNRGLAEGKIVGLKILGDRNTPGTRGGENLLINPFSAYVVNPDKISTDPKPNTAAGTRFLDFLTSERFQAALETFPSAADPAFRGDAFPRIDASIPTAAIAGSRITLSLTAVDRLPGGGNVSGLPVTIEATTDGGKAWSAAATVTTAATGKASATVSITSTTQYRARWSRHGKFSPSSSALGTVTVPSTPAKPGDTVAPKASKLTLTAKKVSVRVSESATVKLTVARQRIVKIRGKARHRYNTVKTTTIKATKASTVSRKLSKLRAARYRVTVVATDPAGNRSTLTKLVTLKERRR